MSSERPGQRAEPGADLDDVVTGADAGQPGDAPDGVRIDDEVLTARLAGSQPVPAQQLTGLSRAERHGRRALPGDADVDRRLAEVGDLLELLGVEDQAGPGAGRRRTDTEHQTDLPLSRSSTSRSVPRATPGNADGSGMPGSSVKRS